MDLYINTTMVQRWRGSRCSSLSFGEQQLRGALSFHPTSLVQLFIRVNARSTCNVTVFGTRRTAGHGRRTMDALRSCCFSSIDILMTTHRGLIRGPQGPFLIMEHMLYCLLCVLWLLLSCRGPTEGPYVSVGQGTLKFVTRPCHTRVQKYS